MQLIVEPNLSLQTISDEHAAELFKVIDTNRNHLCTFLPWVGNMKLVENVYAYINFCKTLRAQGKELSFVILYNNNLVGRVGLHHIDNENKIAAIGYWLCKAAEGKGIITKVCNEIIHYAFEKMNLNRIEIKAATNNLKSQAIPKRLNFSLEGILKQADFVNNEFLDLNLYALLKKDWVSK
jgi:ribosomal-protein-serine acetyltransferase